MKIHHFVYPYTVVDSVVVISDSAIVRQIERVLKLLPGEHIALIHPNGGKVVCEIIAFDREHLTCAVLHTAPASSVGGVHLYLAVLKKEHFEVACQGAVQVGVSAITGMITDRTIKTNINESRLTKLIQESVEQSEQTRIPSFTGIISFSDAVSHACSSGALVLFFDPTGSNVSTISETSKDICVFIGPEGGWSEQELVLIRTMQEDSSAVSVVRCGDSVLRAETAAIVSVYVARSRCKN